MSFRAPKIHSYSQEFFLQQLDHRPFDPKNLNYQKFLENKPFPDGKTPLMIAAVAVRPFVNESQEINALAFVEALIARQPQSAFDALPADFPDPDFAGFNVATLAASRFNYDFLSRIANSLGERDPALAREFCMQKNKGGACNGSNSAMFLAQASSENNQATLATISLLLTYTGPGLVTEPLPGDREPGLRDKTALDIARDSGNADLARFLSSYRNKSPIGMGTERKNEEKLPASQRTKRKAESDIQGESKRARADISQDEKRAAESVAESQDEKQTSMEMDQMREAAASPRSEQTAADPMRGFEALIQAANIIEADSRKKAKVATERKAKPAEKETKAETKTEPRDASLEIDLGSRSPEKLKATASQVLNNTLNQRMSLLKQLVERLNMYLTAADKSRLTTIINTYYVKDTYEVKEDIQKLEKIEWLVDYYLKNTLGKLTNSPNAEAHASYEKLRILMHGIIDDFKSYKEVLGVIQHFNKLPEDVQKQGQMQIGADVRFGFSQGAGSRGGSGSGSGSAPLPKPKGPTGRR